MPAIAPINEIAAKWARVTPGRAEDYRRGVENPRKNWEQETAAAADRWNAGVDLARAENRFVNGVHRAGFAKWQQGAVTKGVARWPEGVRGAQDAYQRGFAPYRDVIERTDLPPRGPKGDPANIERVRVLAQALHAASIGGGR